MLCMFLLPCFSRVIMCEVVMSVVFEDIDDSDIT